MFKKTLAYSYLLISIVGLACSAYTSTKGKYTKELTYILICDTSSIETYYKECISTIDTKDAKEKAFYMKSCMENASQQFCKNVKHVKYYNRMGVETECIPCDKVVKKFYKDLCQNGIR